MAFLMIILGVVAFYTYRFLELQRYALYEKRNNVLAGFEIPSRRKLQENKVENSEKFYEDISQLIRSSEFEVHPTDL